MTMLNKKHKPETIIKMKANHVGFKGKKHTEEAKRKISNAGLGNQHAKGHTKAPWNAGKGISRKERATPNFQRKRYAERRAFIDKLKNVPCLDCKNSFPPECMDFDHRRNKKFTISRFVMKKMSVLLAEIAKCDIVCANCHRIRTKKSDLLRKRLLKE